MRIAVLADIHGNSWALRAVLDHLSRQRTDVMVNLGDIYYGPIDPAGTARVLADNPMLTIAGNQDRMLLAPNPGGIPTFDAVLEALDPQVMEALTALPPTLTVNEDVFLCHGTPGNDSRYLLEDVSSGLPRMRDASAVANDIAGVRHPLILCGHSHLPGMLRVGETLIVNPGSVGLPAYADDDPPHAMSCGSPHARYAVVEGETSQWSAEFFEVEYDWDAAARCAAGNGRDDWAVCLATGRAQAA